MTVRTKANTIYFPINETWTHLLLSRKISYSMKRVEQFNKKCHIHSSSLQQILPEMAKSFPLVTNATHRTPIPPREVNHCGGTAVHTSPPKCPTMGCSAPSVFQAVRDLGVEGSLFLVSSLFYSNYSNQKYFYPAQPPVLYNKNR